MNIDFREAQKQRIQLSPALGAYVGDTVSTSYIVGLQGAYNWSRHITTALDFGWSPLEIDPQSAYGSTVTDKNLFHLDPLLILTTPAAIKVGHKKIMELDIYGFTGVGFTKINTSKLLNGVLGGGILFHVKPPWFGIRGEVRTYIYKLPITRGGFSVDAAIFVGPVFLLVPALL